MTIIEFVEMATNSIYYRSIVIYVTYLECYDLHFIPRYINVLVSTPNNMCITIPIINQEIVVRTKGTPLKYVVIHAAIIVST
jgi:hypothetical protein